MSRTGVYSLLEVRALLSGVMSSFPLQGKEMSEKFEELLLGPLGTGRSGKVPLPWSGRVDEDKCQGIRVNHDLFTQCVNEVLSDGLCKTCQASGAKNETKPGVPVYGTVKDRQSCDAMEYKVTVNGKERCVVPYAKVVSKLGLSEVVVRAIADSQQVTLPEDCFSLLPKKRRTKSAVDVEKSAVITSPATDLVSALVAAAKDSPPSRTDIAKAKLAELKTMCQSYALQSGTKKEMQQRLRKQLDYTDQPKIPQEEAISDPIVAAIKEEAVSQPVVAAIKEEAVEKVAAKPAANTTNDMEEKSERHVSFDTVYTGGGASGLSSAASAEELNEELNEESPLEEEEEVSCDLFTDEKTGIQYMKCEQGRLYDKNTLEEVGMYYGGKVMLDADLEDLDDE